ncbi:MAG: putative metal-dependent phosphoesterase TrpH [Haloarculaceae archaeon]
MTDTRVDLHVKILDEQVVDRAKRRGLDALVYAPHFTRWPDIRERAARFSDEELLVVPGRELFTGDWRTRRHVLALDLSEPVPDFLTLAGTMDELARQDAVVLAPHPSFLTVSLHREHLEQYSEQVDAIEVYNPKHLPLDNRRARRLAEEFDLAPFTSSYAHRRRTIGESWTTFETDIEREEDLLVALREGHDRTVERRRGPVHRLRCWLEFAHLGWENSWKKLDRLYLSGTEPTHPTHVAYDGRFDDVRVY